MADEAVLIFETESPIPFTVDNATGIEKGASLELSDPMTAAAPTFSGTPVAGIAASEKIASDGKVRLGAYRGGIFKVTLSGTCTAGDPAYFDASVNHFTTTVDYSGLSGTRIAGVFLEDGTNGQTVLMELRPQFVGTQ